MVGVGAGELGGEVVGGVLRLEVLLVDDIISTMCQIHNPLTIIQSGYFIAYLRVLNILNHITNTKSFSQP